jgi:hypothetical protein
MLTPIIVFIFEDILLLILKYISYLFIIFSNNNTYLHTHMNKILFFFHPIKLGLLSLSSSTHIKLDEF